MIHSNYKVSLLCSCCDHRGQLLLGKAKQAPCLLHLPRAGVTNAGASPRNATIPPPRAQRVLAELHVAARLLVLDVLCAEIETQTTSSKHSTQTLAASTAARYIHTQHC
jgi:hypothetical protein